jgi:hypothetical protein
MGMAWLLNGWADGDGLTDASLDDSLGASCLDMGTAAWLVNDSADGDGLMVASRGASPDASLDASLDDVWPAVLPEPAAILDGENPL